MLPLIGSVAAFATLSRLLAKPSATALCTPDGLAAYAAVNALRSNFRLPLLSSCTPSCFRAPYPVIPLLTAERRLPWTARTARSPVSGLPDLLDVLYAVCDAIWDSAPLTESINVCILSAIASVSDVTFTETPPVVTWDTDSVRLGRMLLNELVPLVTVYPVPLVGSPTVISAFAASVTLVR